ncbi:hypothetical protein PC129_g3909 [Phytophthora cactorum]|uniref:Uncharacterized protein n=1 Tax=Phytophthora cactorum TaxID=29920 RepID=A0A329SRX3_9STRA|nr:hypothetical protein Pcac1_g3505 [Phytophthora cactorum]KAG2834808.1 hypothetical protein PC112_g5921 [Phytophthora cactorum]KAG2844428.1 hypothetical protein PC111_g1967 [Phytophthora cactorum]KAG2863061.1 hypothetical protein PC113_g5746 [Phytophthora cactorum]KAG2920648.1 hypothetical protein PC114_g6011 [Phytophthora cactorum]
MIGIPVGGHRGRQCANFYSVVLDLLQQLLAISEEELGAASCRMKTELHVINPYIWKVDVNWCEGYMRDELIPLLGAVKQKHPSLALQVLIAGRNGNKFDRVGRLVLDWRPRYRGHLLFCDKSGSDSDMDSNVSIYSWSDSGDDSLIEEKDEVMNED